MTQDKLGWDAVIEGRLTHQWMDVQQRYLTYIGSRRSGKRWLITVIKKLWPIAWDFWQDRNKANVYKRSLRLRRELEDKVSTEFQKGHSDLVHSDKALFTRYTLTVRLS